MMWNKVKQVKIRETPTVSLFCACRVIKTAFLHFIVKITFQAILSLCIHLFSISFYRKVQFREVSMSKNKKKYDRIYTKYIEEIGIKKRPNPVE